MKKILFLSVLLIAFSCGNKNEVKKIAEISCGQCQLGLTGQEGCDLAVRLDGKAYFVDGFGIDDFGDAHEEHTGFCEVIRKAEVVGKVENNRFVATSIKLIDLRITSIAKNETKNKISNYIYFYSSYFIM